MSNASFGSRVGRLLAGFVVAIAGTAVLAGDSAPGIVTIDTYRASTGETYAAIVLQPDVSASATRPLGLVVVVDTSASQTGEHRLAALNLARGLVTGLGKGDSIQLFALDVAPENLTGGLVAAGSDEATAGLAKLEKRAPLGTCDLEAGLRTAAKVLQGLEGHVRSVVYVGDGVNSAGVLTADRFAALTKEFRDSRITVHTVAIGPETNSPSLARLAGETGGRAIVWQEEAGAEAAIGKLQEAIQSPVIYPNSIKLSDGSLPLLPSSVPPLRTDQGTLFLTRGDVNGPLTLAVQGELDGAKFEQEWSVTAKPSSPDNAYLADLWLQWDRERSVAAPGDGRANLALAAADYGQTTESLLVLGDLAVRRGMLGEAEKFLNEVLRRDPSHLEAKSLLNNIAQQRETALAQAQSQDAAAPAAQEPAQAQKPTQPEEAQKPAPPAEQQRATVQMAKEYERAATEKLRTETNAELAEARKLSGTEPQRAVDLLKGRTLLRIDSALDVPEADRASLRRQVESALRQAAREQQRVDLANAEAQQLAARTAEMKRMNNLLMQQQQYLSQLLEQFWALMRERHYREGLSVARRARDLKRDDPLTDLAVVHAERSANVEDQNELLEIRKHRTLLTLLQADKSHIPFPDEPPIEYPDYTWWEEMSKRRQKWAQVDLSQPSKAEAKIYDRLKEPVTLEFVETPLEDVIEFLRDLTDVNIETDQLALQEAGVDKDSPITIHVEQIPLKSALKLTLGQHNLAYIVEDDVLKITSDTVADEKMIHKVYPVADLVIPINSFGGGGAGGFGGGFGGQGGFGGGGGGFGGGGGGFGGGGGGFGGGGGGFGFRNMQNGNASGAGPGAGGAASDDLSDELIRLIQDVIAPETWDVRGGDGSARYYRPNQALVIRQTGDVHGQLSDTLDQLRGGRRAEDQPSRQTGLKNVNPF